MILTGTPPRPAAVLAVCDPWPSASRGEMYSYGKSSLMAAPPPKPAG
ncbi:MAG: hypothetical protein WKF58_09910 [Ilumatobacteraceae bacterium]